MTTPVLGITELAPSQAQPHVLINRAFTTLDGVVQLSVVSFAAAPTGAEPTGTRYIVIGGTGAFVGQDDKVAVKTATGWDFYAPLNGWLAFVEDNGASPAEPGKFYYYDTALSPPGWTELQTGGTGSFNSPTTTKGDLIVRSATADDRLPIGDDGQIPYADSAQPLGIRWDDPPTGGTGGSFINDGAHVYRAASPPSIAHDTLTTLTFDTEARDDGTYSNLGVNNDRLTITTPGWYHVFGAFQWDAIGTGFITSGYIDVNGTTLLQDLRPATNNITNHLSGVLYLAAGDVVKLQAYQSSGGSKSLICSGGMPTLRLHRLGGQSTLANPVNDGALVRRNASAQTIANNTTEKVTFDTEVRDDGGYANLGTNNERLTITRPGWYLVVGNVYWDSNASGLRALGITLNGTADADRVALEQCEGSAGYHSQSVSTVRYFNAGDYLHLTVYQSSGGVRTLSITGGVPNFSVHRLGTNQLPAGGSAGQALVKASAADGDVEWGAAVSDGGGSAVVGLSYRAAQIPPVPSLIPDMTSNTAPSGTMSASSTEPSTAAWRTAASRTSGLGGWVTNATGIGAGQWIKYQFTSAKVVKSYAIIPWTYDLFPARYLSSWKLQGSNDDTNWTDIDSRTKLYTQWAFGSYHYFSCPSNNTAYAYYRLFITGNGGNSYVGITRWELYDVDVDPGEGIVVGRSIQHVDAPPAISDSMDDEFEGTTLSSKWSWRNQGTASATVADGTLLLVAQQAAGDNNRCIEQTVSGTWKFRTKVALTRSGRNYCKTGIVLTNSSSGKQITHAWADYASNAAVAIQRYNSVTSWNANIYEQDLSRYFGNPSQWVYLEVENDGTNLYFRISSNGVAWALLATEALATFISSVDRIGLLIVDTSNNAVTAHGTYGWFRRIGTGYAPGTFAVNARMEPTTVNVTPDTHPAVPNAIDDEFEGTSLDSRWVQQNVTGTITPTVANGSLVLTATANNSRRSWAQTISGTFKLRAKMTLESAYRNDRAVGWLLYNVANNKQLYFLLNTSGAGAARWIVVRETNWGSASYPYSPGVSDWRIMTPQYLEVESDGTTIYFRQSHTGVDGTFLTYHSETIATHLVAAPDRVGFSYSCGGGSTGDAGVIDWFRRIA